MALQWELPVSWLLRESHVSNPLFVVPGPVSGTGSVKIETSCSLWPALSLGTVP